MDMNNEIQPEEEILLNDRVWNILTIKEQTALTLSYSLQKSSWQAGTTMNIAHYKYLELLKRADHFFKIFTVHYDTYGELVPKSVNIPRSVRAYFEHLIIDRKKISELHSSRGINDFRNTKKREVILTGFLTKIESMSKNRKAYRDFYNLILEFDRYNNFRIIPDKFQLPSPSQRKVKVILKNLIKFHTNLDIYLILKLIDLFSGTVSKDDNLQLYIPIISRSLEDGYKIIHTSLDAPDSDYKKSTNVHNSDVVRLSGVGLPIFLNEHFAKRHSELVIKYTKNEHKGSISQAQRFWSMYRDNLQNAVNYQELIIQKGNKNTLTDRLIKLANSIK